MKNPPQTGAHQGQNAMPPMGEEEIIGDASFSGSIGRMSFSDSSELDMKVSLDRFVSLADELAIIREHRPTTTLGQEATPASAMATEHL